MSAAHDFHREALLRKRDSIVSALGADRGQPMERVGEEDQVSIAHEEFVSMRLNRMDYAKLRLIEEALDRIESGDYGICLECEEPITLKRLAALPWARYCIPCQEQAALEEYAYPLAS